MTIAERATSTAKTERLTIWALVVTMIANQTGVVIISPLLVDIAATFDVSVAAATQIRTVAALSSGLLAPWIGVVSDRIGRRPVLLVGLAVMAVTALASAAAPTFYSLLATQLVVGFAIACLLSMGLASVGDYFPPERRGWAMGMVMIGQPLAYVIGLPLIGLLADLFGWRWSFVGVPFVFSLVGLWFASRLPRIEQVEKTEAARLSSRPTQGIRQIFANRSAASWVLAELCTYIGWAGTLTFLGYYYISRYGLTAGWASPLLALTGLGFVGGSLVAHRLARRWDQRLLILCSSIGSAALMLAPMLIRFPLVVATVLFTLFGLAQGIRGASSSVLGLQQVPEHRGAMMALRASCVQFGYVFGGIVGGLMLSRGGLSAVAVIFAVAIIIAGVVTQFLVQVNDPQRT